MTFLSDFPVHQYRVYSSVLADRGAGQMAYPTTDLPDAYTSSCGFLSGRAAFLRIPRGTDRVWVGFDYEGPGRGIRVAILEPLAFGTYCPSDTPLENR